ncbi:MAG: lysine 2,3-aminomutase [Myxococcota bacterium]
MGRFSPISSVRHARWADVALHQWDDWRWQQQNRVTTLAELQTLIPLTSDESEAFRASADKFRVAITPYYLSLIDPADPSCPVRRQAVPSSAELQTLPGELEDPLAEEAHMPVPGLTHRYPDRALLYTTHNCPVYCRFCTRKRKVGDPGSTHARPELFEAVEYIRRTPAIRDVIVSGGDPLSLSNERLSELLGALAAIEHVDVIRLGTRNPVTLPQRIDAGLAEVLTSVQKAGAAVWLMTHFNHPRECTSEAAAAVARILATGTPVQNQMVLLHGINDSGQVVESLNRRLLRMRVKPYYMIHADLAEGIGHFRTTVQAGRDILEHLRGRVSGLAIPIYVVDLPGGGGKVPISPDYRLGPEPNGTRFRNYQGREFVLPDREES